MIADKIKAIGYFHFKWYTEDGEFIKDKIVTNVIVNGGLERHSEILAGDELVNTVLSQIEFGSSTTAPTDRTKTTLVTPVESRIPFTGGTVGSSFPYEVVRTVTIPASQFTRPLTVYEMGAFFGDNVMWNRAVEVAGIVMGVGQVMIIDYGVYLT